jgi:hypothetical protein
METKPNARLHPIKGITKQDETVSQREPPRNPIVKIMHQPNPFAENRETIEKHKSINFANGYTAIWSESEIWPEMKTQNN